MLGLTPAQIAFCNSASFIREIRKAAHASKCDQSFEMSVLIALFAQIAKVNVDCPTLNALAAQYNCLPRQNQLPALIYLASQILTNGTGGGAVDYIPYPGPPTIAPGIALNGYPPLLNIVVDSNGQQWQYFAGGWN